MGKESWSKLLFRFGVLLEDPFPFPLLFDFLPFPLPFPVVGVDLLALLPPFPFPPPPVVELLEEEAAAAGVTTTAPFISIPNLSNSSFLCSNFFFSLFCLEISLSFASLALKRAVPGAPGYLSFVRDKTKDLKDDG